MSSEESGIYEIEAILKKRMRKGKTQYLIKWLGYPDEENTWEDEENVYAKDILDQFNSKKVKITKKNVKFSINDKVTEFIKIYDSTNLNLPSLIDSVYDIETDGEDYVTRVKYVDGSLGIIPYFILKKEAPDHLFKVFEKYFFEEK